VGTNYYHEERLPCVCCKRAFEQKHIGKSSAGWCFALRVYPAEGPRSLEEWRQVWGTGRIVSEYGDIITPQEMDRIITNRAGGLRRHDTDGRLCIGHGDGTWDLIVGDFS
jgi:hypothetical protein